MASHSPYTHQGPVPSSYFQSSQNAYGSPSPGPRSNHYPFPPHPHMPHPYYHPPSRGGQRAAHTNSSYSSRASHHYHLPYHPATQHPPYPPHVGVHLVQHAGQLTPTHSTNHNLPYSPSHHYPSPTAPVFTPSWQAQPISSLPNQLSMPLPQDAYDSSQIPQSESSPVAQSSSNASEQSTTSETLSVPLTTTVVKPAAEADTTEPPVDEIASPTTATDLTVDQEPMIQIPDPSYMGTIPTDSSVQPSSLMTPTNPVVQWAICSCRPRVPSQAPSITFSPKARPPLSIIQRALLPLCPPSLVSESSVTPAKDVSLESSTIEIVNLCSSQIDSTPSSATESTDTPAAPGSPVSSHTSVSIACTPVKNPIEVPTHTEEHDMSLEVPSASTSTGVVTAETSNESVTVSIETVRSTPRSSTSDDTATTAQPSQFTVAASPPPPAAPKKSWASLFRNSASNQHDPSRNALPTSSVVGVSIPASTQTNPPISPSHKSDLIALLTTGPSELSTVASLKADSVKFRPRGLVNSGNMCFANAVLQILVYCPPFHKLFAALGQLLVDGNAKEDLTGKIGTSPSTPFVNATAVFLQEFMESNERKAKKLDVVSKGGINGSSGSNIRSGGKGKEKEKEFMEEKPVENDYEGESFLPTYVYDAMKTKKRFDTMRGGHQEDAEEFLGFYLDTLEEELLSIINPPRQVKGDSAAPVEEKEEAPLSEDGWLEVGKRNRMIVTRTIKAAESPISKIFGGRFRSTLHAPGQKDSVIVEDWRSLRLDIQRDQIHTIQDALSLISQPQPVQVTHSTRTGVIVDAHQQVLIEALPPILVLHIKRFYYDTAVGGVAKVSKHVRYGPELVISSDVMFSAVKRTQPIRYKLFGALYHHGHSASGGHYTLDVLHPNRYPIPKGKPQEGWIRIDDELVSDVRPEDVFSTPEKGDTRCAYLLFYRRI